MKMNRKYYVELFHYLTDNKACCQHYRALSRDHKQNKFDTPRQETEHALRELLRHPELREYDDVISELTELLNGAGLLSQVRFAQYRIIMEVLQRFPYISIADVLRFLERICERNHMSEPAYCILYDHYGEIIRSLFNSCNPEDRFINDPLDESLLLRILSDFIMCELDPEQIVIHLPGEDLDLLAPVSNMFTENDSETDDDEESEEDDDEFEFEFTGDDNEFLQDFVITVFNQELERYASKQDCFYIPPTLFKNEEVYIEDLVTFVNFDYSRGVTFQIIGEGCLNGADFDCYFESLEDQKGVDRNKDTLDFSHSYKVLRLPYPVITETDLLQYKQKKKETDYGQ